jgi:chromatin structure-remodeling complex protein RSC7
MCHVTDGKWVVDDYYEDRALEEATSKGFNAGDLVGDLPDPSMYAEANKLDAVGGKGGANIQGKADRSGAGLGLYRAGGPTTIFGGLGWGPYSDGPLNAVRKSLLHRDGLNEENWMHIAAQRTADAGEEFSKIRREALQLCGGVQDRELLPLGDEIKKRKGEDGLGGEGKRRKKMRSIEDGLPLGVYEAHSGVVHCKFLSFVFTLKMTCLLL